MKAAAVIAVCALYLIQALPASACTQPADPDEWRGRNEAAAAQVRDWDSLADYYHIYVEGMCENASVAELYPDLVAARFVRQWEDFPRFVDIGDADPAFRAFVLRQLESEMYSLDDARATYRLARDRCPGGFEAVCRSVMAAVTTSNPDGVRAD